MSSHSVTWRRVGSTMAVLGCVTLAAHGAVWIWSVDRLDTSIERQVEALRLHGWAVTLGPVRRMGWPARARIDVGPASIATAGLTLQAQSVMADIGLFRPGPPTVRSAGHSVRWGQGPAIPIMSREVSTAPRDDGIAVTGTNIAVINTGEAAAFQLWIEAAGLRATLQDLRFTNTSGRPAPPIDSVSFSLESTAPLPYAVGSRAAAMWRKSGNSAGVSAFHMTARGMTLSGHATIWLDAALQPSLDGMVHIVGYTAVLDGLAAAGLVRAQTATAAKAVLGLLTAPSVDGSVDVPVQIKDGVLTAAHFALLRVPILEWPRSDPGP